MSAGVEFIFSVMTPGSFLSTPISCPLRGTLSQFLLYSGDLVLGKRSWKAEGERKGDGQDFWSCPWCWCLSKHGTGEPEDHVGRKGRTVKCDMPSANEEDQ